MKSGFTINNLKVNDNVLNQNENIKETDCGKIDFEDIRYEVEFWESVLVIYVLGCNFFVCYGGIF